MELHNLKPAKGSTHKKKIIGRGEGSGHGGTATRGHKGAQARAGYSRKIGFEGGQMPIQRRLPKFGFKNINRVVFLGINVKLLLLLGENNQLAVIDLEVLKTYGMVSKTQLVKILGNGDISIKLDVTANAFSKSAIEKIEKAGGKVTTI